jgi:hypothetical protein
MGIRLRETSFSAVCAACPVLDFALRRLVASFELQRRGLCGVRARRGCRLGQHVRRSRLPPSCTTSAALRLGEIPTITGNRRHTMSTYRVDSAACRRRELIDVITHQIPPTRPSPNAPSIYVLNAAALSKPGAVQHLAADLESYGVSVAVITETHMKTKHTDSIVSISGYTLYRRDRTGRRGGGVAVYLLSALRSSRWTPSIAADSTLEIDWVRVGESAFVAALYHPPRPTYRPEVLL